MNIHARAAVHEKRRGHGLKVRRALCGCVFTLHCSVNTHGIRVGYTLCTEIQRRRDTEQTGSYKLTRVLKSIWIFIYFIARRSLLTLKTKQNKPDFTRAFTLNLVRWAPATFAFNKLYVDRERLGGTWALVKWISKNSRLSTVVCHQFSFEEDVRLVDRSIFACHRDIRDLRWFEWRWFASHWTSAKRFHSNDP